MPDRRTRRGGDDRRARGSRAWKERRGVVPRVLGAYVPPGSLLPRAQTRATPRRRGRRRSDGRGPSWGRLICARRSRGAARGLPRFWNPARGARGCARKARRTSTTSLAFWLGEASDARVNAETRVRRAGYPHGSRTEPNDDAPTVSSHSKSERFPRMRSRFDRRVICPHAGARSVKIFVRPRERSFLESFSSLRSRRSNPRDRRSRTRITPFGRPGPTGFDRRRTV